MTPSSLFALCAFLLSTTFANAFSEDGLIRNGSFEDESPVPLMVNTPGQTETLQTTSWFSIDAATRSDEKSHSGQWSAKLVTKDENIGPDKFGQFMWTFIEPGKMIPGGTLRVSAWVLNETFLSGSGTPTIWIEILPPGGEGETIKESAPLPEEPTDGWVQVKVEAKVPEDFNADFRVRVGVSVVYDKPHLIEPGAMHFDDFEGEIHAD